ncbi:MAG: MBL fold metallo-hydrolase [Chloroflexi bacterium]|nr:MBL fold metallo-hydrolase [Chloroflexota bacterium]MDA1270165.1 MBL fold metallo-hydrolase [Chloroflexota bacterium]
MQITDHIYATHIEEDPGSFGAMHPGGTHIYFVGDPKDHMVMVDSGEPYRSWTRQIKDYHAELGKPRISSIVITHGHGDHIGGLDRLQEEFGCVVRCHPKLEPALTHRLGEGNVVKLRSRESVPTGGGAKLRAHFTPGHEEDHVSYYMAEGKVIFSGDTILGNSSSSVRNLKQYMTSLETLAGLKPEILCPGHGQVLNKGTARVEWYIRHRTEREEQVLAALAKGVDSVEEIVTAVYPRNLRRNLRAAAGRNVRTHLDKLIEEGRVDASQVKFSIAAPGKRT